MASAFEPHGALIENDADGALGARGECADPFALTRNTRARRGDVRRKTGAQPLRHAGEAFAPAFDIHPQQLRYEAAADARKQHTMNLRIGVQGAGESGGGKIEPLSRQRQHLVGVGQRPCSRTQFGPPRLLIAPPGGERPPRQ